MESPRESGSWFTTSEPPSPGPESGSIHDSAAPGSQRSLPLLPQDASPDNNNDITTPGGTGISSQETSAPALVGDSSQRREKYKYTLGSIPITTEKAEPLFKGAATTCLGRYQRRYTFFNVPEPFQPRSRQIARQCQELVALTPSPPMGSSALVSIRACVVGDTEGGDKRLAMVITSNSPRYAALLKRRIEQSGILRHDFEENTYDVVILEGGFASLEPHTETGEGVEGERRSKGRFGRFFTSRLGWTKAPGRIVEPGDAGAKV
ncbi:hypothetical protein QBC47DRAFT_392201 [Echria macrotheca]|uniref:Uncharacterized protein n=1 Tax=Echria macrotheca TaxID=438768 RepID=A0AAJ0B5B3_9PEZI|nr:hypothetical protein QBC47DRAFT_392201 [Echria macrotheca]